MQGHIIEVKGTDIGDQFLQSEKESILDCHSYQFLINSEPFAKMFTGTSHSNDRYVVIEMGETLLKINDESAFFRYEYVLIEQHTKVEIGYFRFGSELFELISGSLTTSENFQFKQVSVGELFNPGTWEMRKYTLSNHGANIGYTGAFNGAAFNGFINTNGSEKYIEAIVGVFVIDEKYRLDQERTD